MSKPKKVLTDLQKQIFALRTEAEAKLAEKAAAEEQINRLTFTLFLYQSEKSLDETIQEKMERLKDRISELEDQVRQIPRDIRKLEARQRELRASEPPTR